MEQKLTIGQAARRTGLSAKTIRFYEDEGVLPRPRRSESGYRLYGDAELVRLGLVRKARLLGLDLPAIRSLLRKALDADCARFGDELLETLSRQRNEVEARIQELQALLGDLDQLMGHVRHCCESCNDTAAVDCGYCFLITQQEGGEPIGDDRRAAGDHASARSG